MWIAVTYVRPHETGDAGEEPLVLLSIVRPDGSRVMRMRARPEAVPEAVRMMRAASEGAPRGMPGCHACGHTFDLPDLDRREPSCAGS
jgi:hypothetical protein